MYVQSAWEELKDRYIIFVDLVVKIIPPKTCDTINMTFKKQSSENTCSSRRKGQMDGGALILKCRWKCQQSRKEQRLKKISLTPLANTPVG